MFIRTVLGSATRISASPAKSTGFCFRMCSAYGLRFVQRCPVRPVGDEVPSAFAAPSRCGKPSALSVTCLSVAIGACFGWSTLTSIVSMSAACDIHHHAGCA